jgi:hypothetical protein
MAKHGEGARRKEIEIEPRLMELRQRMLAGQPMFLSGERFEIGGRDDSGPDIVYRPAAPVAAGKRRPC